MSFAEILEELPKLNPDQRQILVERLHLLEGDQIEETPDALAALDAARQSIREGKHHTIEQARDLVNRWTTKSS